MSGDEGIRTSFDTGRCAPEGHCVTCSDEGIPMRVESLDADDALAICIDADGRRWDVQTALIENVQPADELLVHAGVALTRLKRRPQ